MNYGLPYMGSKNFIAEWVLSKIPPRTNFYDLFCGGGAITHAALLAKKHRRFFMNDLNPFSALFFDAVSGKYHNETRWVSRETFEREKTKDPYIAFVGLSVITAMIIYTAKKSNRGNVRCIIRACLGTIPF